MATGRREAGRHTGTLNTHTHTHTHTHILYKGREDPHNELFHRRDVLLRPWAGGGLTHDAVLR